MSEKGGLSRSNIVDLVYLAFVLVQKKKSNCVKKLQLLETYLKTSVRWDCVHTYTKGQETWLINGVDNQYENGFLIFSHVLHYFILTLWKTSFHIDFSERLHFLSTFIRLPVFFFYELFHLMCWLPLTPLGLEPCFAMFLCDSGGGGLHS